MSHQSELIATDIEAYLAQHESKDLLRFLTCGSVDDGKSTLIGRLLHDSKMIYEDQLAAIHEDSETVGTTEEGPDLALLTDGLKAEREQGITIDVAYRYFSTARRKFIIADTPGHEQYTRNMVTGASTCDLSIILLDARSGVLAQTKRHTYISRLLGIRHLVVAINKMDLVDYSQDRFEEICESYRQILGEVLDGVEPYFLPISALNGDNVVETSSKMSWFEGPTLMEHLETVPVSEAERMSALRFPVQLVSRPNSDFRGYAGTIASGSVSAGDEVVALPSGMKANIAQIATFDGDVETAVVGDAVTLCLDHEIDVSRGDILCSPTEIPKAIDHLEVMLVWMQEEPADMTRSFLIQAASGTANARISTIIDLIDAKALEELGSSQGAHREPHSHTQLGLNDVARCTLRCDKQMLFDAYSENRITGSFILVDRMTNATVAAGMVTEAASNWDATPEGTLTKVTSGISVEERAQSLNQKPVTVFITGLSAAGKSTLAVALSRRLFDMGKTVFRMDGQNVRLGMSRDLGFSAQERSENLRRVAEVARLANDQGQIVVAALVAPKSEARRKAKELIGFDKFVEVFLDTPIEVCRQRDTNGLYEAADRGEIPMFPGVSATYDRPTTSALTLDRSTQTVQQCVDQILALLGERGFLSA